MTPIKNAMTAALANATTTPKSKTTAEWQPQLDAYEPTLALASQRCREFVSAMESGLSPRWLTLTGDAGCGKTMLARQIWAVAEKLNPGGASLWVDPSNRGKRRPRTVWLDATRFADRMKEGEFDLPEYLADDFLVVLDDLGAARDKTSFVADAIYRLCNARREGWTVFTSNLTLPEISERVDERVASRLIRDNNTLLTIKAGDYALSGRKPTASAALPAHR